MRPSLRLYLILTIGLSLFAACRQAKYVPDGQYLLKKNYVQFTSTHADEVILVGSHDLLSGSEMLELVNPKPNNRVRLFVYNRIDTTKHNRQVERKKQKYQAKLFPRFMGVSVLPTDAKTDRAATLRKYILNCGHKTDKSVTHFFTSFVCTTSFGLFFIFFVLQPIINIIYSSTAAL